MMLTSVNSVSSRMQLCGPTHRVHIRPFRAIPSFVVHASGGGLNPFRRNAGQQDAAKKALEDALKGSRDVFKEAEELATKRAKRQAETGSGGGGGKGAGGNGGGGGWWEWGRSWGGQFWRAVLAFVKGLATLLLFLGFLCGVSLWKPIFNALGHLTRILLRLDRNPFDRSQATTQGPQVDLTTKDTLGAVEKSVIAKYGAEAADDDDDDEEDEEEDSPSKKISRRS